MKLCADKYDRSIKIKAPHFYETKSCLQEVPIGQDDELHIEDLIPRSGFLESIILNIFNLKLSDRTEFGGINAGERSRSVRGSASLNASSGLGLSYFGTWRLINNLSVSITESDDLENSIYFRPVMFYEETNDYDHTRSNEGLNVFVIMNKNSFAEFLLQVEQNSKKQVLQLEINLETPTGIYEYWDPSGDFTHNNILKILTDQILETAVGDTSQELETINQQEINKFSISWMDQDQVEWQDKESLEDDLIELEQSRGSEQKVTAIKGRYKQSWIKRNWIVLLILIVALISYATRM